MSRIQLVVRENGKEPRVVPLSDAIVVGRSRKAGLTIADEEVGREQFRIGVEHGMVVIEGIGKTNRTTVDGVPLGAGERTVVAPGSSIRVGRTTFEIQSGDSTEEAGGRPGEPDLTMVAPGPIAPSAPRAPSSSTPMPPSSVPKASGVAPGAPGIPPSPPGSTPEAPGSGLGPQDETGGYKGPMQTMEFVRPGAQAPRPGANTPSSPGSAKPPTPTPATGNDVAPEVTMNLKGGYRPGMANPASQPPPAAKAPAPAPAPARAPTPAPTPAPAPAATPTPPPAAKPVTTIPPVVTTPPGSTPPRERPKTVAVSAQEMDAMRAVGGAPDLEARLHVSLPRLLVKAEGIKRRIRLMKAQNKVGRAETADVLLPHESVSEQHAEIRFDGTSWHAADCGSTNGTLVDGTLLRSSQQQLRRHSLLGIGSLKALFLCNDATTARADQRLEDRALRLLVRAGRLPKEEARRLTEQARAETSQSIAETLLLETAIGPTEWAQAVDAVRLQISLLERLRNWWARRRGATRPPS